VSDRIVATVEDAEKRGERVLESARSLATELGVTVESEVAVRVAGDGDRFVRGDGRLRRRVRRASREVERVERLLGSVAKDLVEMASCPVTVVR